jgi:hypothetical protein
VATTKTQSLNILKHTLNTPKALSFSFLLGTNRKTEKSIAEQGEPRQANQNWVNTSTPSAYHLILHFLGTW